jgi:hypothetical protein
LIEGGIFLGQSVGSKDFIYKFFRKENGNKYPLSPEHMYELLQQFHFKSICIEWKERKESENDYWGHFTFYGEKE